MTALVKTSLLGLALTALLAGIAPAARAQDPVLSPAASQGIFVARNKSAAFRLEAPAGKIVVAQPDIAEIVATTDQSFYVRGKALGTTNILIYNHDLRLMQVIDVRVGYDAASVQADIASAMPAEHILVSNLADGLLLAGQASTPDMADRALALAERTAPKAVTSTISVRESQQISLDVRIVEVNRTALDDFGIDLTADSGGGIVFAAAQALSGAASPAGTLTLTPRLGVGSLNATLRALEQKGLAKTLAKPNLTAMSGQEANFLAGGEIPIPVPDGHGGATIEYRQFGVQLNFTPTLHADGMIRMKVAPEVSDLDPNNGVTILNFRVPALSVRRASTTVELRDGQSFAIAGLFHRIESSSVSQVPGIGAIPILGALFRSSSWQHNETELVIVVTPRLVKGDSEAIPDPLQADREPSAIDLILQGLATGQPAKPADTPTAAKG